MRQRSWLDSQRMLARRSADGGEAALFRTLVDGRFTDEAKKLARRAAAVAEMLARRAAAVAEMPCSGCIPLSGCGGGRRLRGGDAAPRGIGRESCVGSSSVTRVTLLLLLGKPPLPRAWRGILSLLQHAAAASDSFPSLPSPLGCRTALHPHAEAALRPPRPALRPFCWQCFFLIKMHHNSHIIPIQTGLAHPCRWDFM